MDFCWKCKRWFTQRLLSPKLSAVGKITVHFFRRKAVAKNVFIDEWFVIEYNFYSASFYVFSATFRLLYKNWIALSCASQKRISILWLIHTTFSISVDKRARTIVMRALTSWRLQNSKCYWFRKLGLTCVYNTYIYVTRQCAKSTKSIFFLYIETLKNKGTN